MDKLEIVILAGGLGTRLRSVINEVPKCMAPVAGRPFLWYLLKYLTRFDVTKVIFSVGYLRDVIYSWVNEVKCEFPFEFDYAVEEQPLGTGGGIKLALSKATSKTAVVLNGDTFFDVDLSYLFKKHSEYKTDITLALKPMLQFERYGNVQIEAESNVIKAFEEKKYCAEGFINGGVYVINKNTALFKGLPDKFSFETEILQSQCALGKLNGLIQDGYFIDIGIPEDYVKASMDFQDLPF